MADKVFTARWVFPVSGPPLERGVLVISGRKIVAVEPQGKRIPDLDFGNAAITPGFVNAHTHLDLTGARGLTPPTPDFTAWLRSVIAYRRGRSPHEMPGDIQEGIWESLRHGTTMVGDISVESASWEPLGRASMRALVYRELIGTSTRGADIYEGCRTPAGWSDESQHTWPGFSPHAPYSASLALIEASCSCGFPVAIHVAETLAELELIEHRTGPFVEFLRDLNAWHPERMARSVADIVMATSHAVQSLFVHCNYMAPDMDLPTAASIVYCPRTHAAFGHPPHPFREFLARGVRVALGTDSLASNPDLSLLAETRFIASRYSDFDRAALLRMATLSGAEALGWADVAGSLEPGKSADFAVVAMPDRDDADPHELLFNSDLPVQQTWFRGQCVFKLV
jgi:cytosine/adenosine deaminase-related metal-dependent hydrolase